MMLSRNLRSSVPFGLWKSPHRSDKKRLDRQPSHLRATCDIPVAEPTTAHLFTGCVSATPIASTYCLHACSRQGCTRAYSSERARASSRQSLEIDIAKLISPALQQVRPACDVTRLASDILWYAMGTCLIPLYPTTNFRTPVRLHVIVSRAAGPQGGT